MIAWLIIAIIAAIMETSGILFPSYLIIILVLYLRNSFERTIWIAVISGLVLDVLTPRPLGLSAIIALLILIILEKSLGASKDKGIWYYATGLLLIVLEGIVVGRGFGVIALQLIGYVTLVFVLNSYLTQRFAKQLIVRREI